MPGPAAPLLLSPLRHRSAPVPEDVLTQFNRVYSLSSDLVIKCIAPPFSQGRNDFGIKCTDLRAGDKPELPDGMIVRWQEGQPLAIQNSVDGSSQGFDVRSLLELLSSRNISTTEGDEKLLKTFLPGDFVVCSGATPDQLLVGLEQILQRDVDPSICLQFGNIPKPAYVLRGQWNYKPVMASNEAIPQIHIYTTDLKSDRTPPVSSTGIPLRVLGGRLAMCIGDYPSPFKLSTRPPRSRFGPTIQTAMKRPRMPNWL